MGSRVRYGLVISAVVFFLLGCGAFILLTFNTFSMFSTSSSGLVTYDESGMPTSSYSGPSATSQVMTTLLPASGVVFLAVSVVCVAGAVASLVASEAVDRAHRLAVASAPAAPPEPMSAPETLDG